MCADDMHRKSYNSNSFEKKTIKGRPHHPVRTLAYIVVDA
jgi:hypothetical protein